MTEDVLAFLQATLAGKDTDEVIPVLIAAAARALVIQANGDINLLSTLLLKFCRLVQNAAADMLEQGPSE